MKKINAHQKKLIIFEIIQGTCVSEIINENTHNHVAFYAFQFV